MRTLLSFLVLTMLIFAVSGGGGGSSAAKKEYTLTPNFSCSTNELTITASEDGKPVEGMGVNIQRNWINIGSGKTDRSGMTKFTVRSGESYFVTTSKTGYEGKDLTVSLETCKVETTDNGALLCDQPTRAERAKCILRLSNKERGEVNYLPEECREQEETGKQRCVATYRLFQACRNLETDRERAACIKPKLNVSGEVREVLQQCQGKVGAVRAACVQQIRENVLSLVKFRMYNLEYKAEEFLELGVPEEDVIAIIAKIDEAKIAFNDAGTIREKIAVIKQLKQDWQDFVAEARKQLEAVE